MTQHKFRSQLLRDYNNLNDTEWAKLDKQIKSWCLQTLTRCFLSFEYSDEWLSYDNDPESVDLVIMRGSSK